MIRDFTKAINNNKPFVLIKVQNQSQMLGVKGLFGLFVFEKLKKLLIQLVTNIYIAFTIIKNSTFYILFSQFSSTLIA